MSHVGSRPSDRVCPSSTRWTRPSSVTCSGCPPPGTGCLPRSPLDRLGGASLPLPGVRFNHFGIDVCACGCCKRGPGNVAEQLGRYRAERRLGTGAFATVWLAHDDALEAQVAIKVLADNWAHDDDIRRRFMEEARILWRLDSDRIVRVHAVDTLEDGRPYFVMDYADLGSLADRMRGRVDSG